METCLCDIRNRMINDKLMINDSIVSRKSAQDDLFTRYAAAVQSLLLNVVDIKEQDTIACCHRREAYKKALFEEEFTKWFNSARQFVSAESTRVSAPGVISPEVPCRTPPEFPREIPHETSLYIPCRTSPEFPREVSCKTSLHVPHTTPPEIQGQNPPVTPRGVPRVTPREQLLQRGTGLRRSSSGKSSKARLVVARLKVRKLEEEQRIKAMEYDLEKQRLQLEMDARVEVEQAQI